MLFIILLLDTL